MKIYLMRSVRYLLRMIVILGVVLALMSRTNTLNVQDGEFLQALFLSGRGAILLVLLLVLAALYPKLSFTKRDVRADLSVDRKAIIDAFANCGYIPAKETDGQMVFRAAKRVKRVLLQWDDAVTVTGDGNYVTLEGLKKEVSRIELRLNAFLGR